MGEKADLIERHIQQQRGEFGDNVLELKQKVRRSVDWRVHVEERPLTMLGLAFGAGVLLSVLLDGRRGYLMPRLSSDVQPEYRASAHGDTWEILKGAAIGPGVAVELLRKRANQIVAR